MVNNTRFLLRGHKFNILYVILLQITMYFCFYSIFEKLKRIFLYCTLKKNCYYKYEKKKLNHQKLFNYLNFYLLLR